jgi:AcrR family transcriptional regulator
VAKPSRAEAQQQNRAKILAAARATFAARGFRDVKIDDIAEEAELTRGAVYSNFPGKRALYFAVLANETADVPALKPAETIKDALSGFALVSVRQHSRLAQDLMPQILAEESSRKAYAQLVELNSIMLGLGLENMHPRVTGPWRRVRLATMALTTLSGASQLQDVDPDLVEPFDVIGACEALADLDINDAWAPTPEPSVRTVDWNPPEARDALYGTPVDLDEVTFLGLHRLGAVEDVARRKGTVVIVMAEPDELGPLVRLNLARLGTVLSHTLAPESRPDVRIVCDETGAIAQAAGVPVSDRTDTAVRSASSDRQERRPRSPAMPRSG